MIKLVIFDLDGVLVNARELHYEALNKALEHFGKQFVINRAEHLSTYDGRSTTVKLNMLHEQKGLPKTCFDEVWQRKQDATLKIISEEYTHDDKMRYNLKTLKERGYRIAVASNSIRETVKMFLVRLGLMEYVEFFYSNQDVTKSKPYTEMYLKCMIKAQVSPKETLIVEDSHIGRKAAFQSGATVHGVIDADDVRVHDIIRKIKMHDEEQDPLNRPKWQGGKLNILIPMAGAGSRFEKAGYTFPKPLIDVNGKPMIQTVVDNLNIEANYIFIVQKEHHERYNLQHMLELIAPGCKVVVSKGEMKGAAWDTLVAKELIDNDDPLLMANSDQFVEWDSNEFMYAMGADGIDGGILTFTATHPKWSFAKLGEDNYVTEVAEKKPISDIATVGIYYWAKGSDYVKYAEQMIEKEIKTNNEYYVCPVFNEAIGDGKKIKVFPIKKMWGLGTPEDLSHYLENHRDK